MFRLRASSALPMGFAVLGALTFAGCAGSGAYMTEVKSPQAIAAPVDSAVVVFVRPTSVPTGIRTTILDNTGKFLGEVAPKSHFAAYVAPGDHVFLAWAENTAAIRASVVAGKRYYVRLAPRMGAFSARMQLFAVTPKSVEWGKLKGWLADTKQLAPNQPAGQEYLASRQDDVQKRIARANEILKEYTPKELAERTIQPEDGE